jgi:uncharacterized membrane protein
MNGQNNRLDLRKLGLGSILLGILGGAFYWWAPLGLVLSMSGSILGFVDWNRARKHSLDNRLSIAAMIISLATLVLCIVVMAMGWQSVTFGRR